MNISGGTPLRRAEILINADRLDEAEAILRPIAKGRGTSVGVLHSLGVIELRRNRYQKAQALFNRALRIRPKDAHLHLDLALALGPLGYHKRALAHFRQAVRLKPDLAIGYFYLTHEVRVEADDPLIRSIEGLLTKGTLSQADQCFLNFAAGKAYDDTGDHDRAMAHFHKSNAAKGARYDPEATKRFLEQTTAFHTLDFMASLTGAGLEDERMVFVVGMPRSGTSLVEQIIASHPRAHGAGELANLQVLGDQVKKAAERPTDEAMIRLEAGRAQPLGTMLRLLDDKPSDPESATTGGLDAARVRSLAERYLQEVRAREIGLGMDPDAMRIVDKNPANFRYMGLIALMFPRARIIHCRRDPRDTGLSCYFQNFHNRHHHYAFDLAHLGSYYRHYLALMRHWRDILGIEMLEVDYERLVAEPEPAMREIIAYCGLPWDAACLEFDKTKRPVLTASAWQVRQPLYQGSAGRWRHYEKHLGPLLEALGEDGTELA